MPINEPLPVGPYSVYVPPEDTAADKAKYNLPVPSYQIPGVQPAISPPASYYEEEARLQEQIDKQKLDEFITHYDWGEEAVAATDQVTLIDQEISDTEDLIEQLKAEPSMGWAPGLLTPTGLQEAVAPYTTIQGLGNLLPDVAGKLYSTATGFMQDPTGVNRANKIAELEHYARVTLTDKKTIAILTSLVYTKFAQMIQTSFTLPLSIDRPFDTVDEVMTYLMEVGSDGRPLPKESMEELRAIVQELIDYYGSGEGKLSPEQMVYEPLEAPIQPTPPRPVSLHQLTTQEILDSMAFIPPPDTTFTQEEWETYLKEQELYSDEDIDEIFQVHMNEFIEDWKETVSNLQAYRKGMAEMPAYTWIDFIKTAATMPTLAGLDMVGNYFKYGSQPWAGYVMSNFFGVSEIQTEVDRMTDVNSSTWDKWLAYGEAFEDWDAPGDGTQEWMLKYLVIEGMLDPLSWVGFGVATRLTSPFGAFGRGVRWAEESFNLIGDIPIDMFKKGIGYIPKTAGQRYGLYGAGALKNKGKVEEQFFPGKRWKDLTPEETVEVAEYSIDWFRKNPWAKDRTARYGRDLLISEELDETMITKLIGDLDQTAGGTVRSPEELALFLTKDKVAAVQHAFELNFLFRSSEHILANKLETAAIIRNILQINPVDTAAFDAVDNLISAFLDTRAKGIVNNATKIFRESTNPLKGASEWNEQMFRYFANAEQSATALSMKDKGVWGKKLAQVPIDVQRVWVDYVDKYLVKTFSEAYLTFGMYGPMNTFEDIFRSLLSGVNPHRMQVDDWMTLAHGLEVDPNLWLHAGISELYGPFKAYGVGPDWSNWLLQGFGLWAGTGERLYKYGVRWPGALSQDFRRNAIAGYYVKFLREEAPEALEQLGKIIGKGPNISDKGLYKEVGEYLSKIITTGDSDMAYSIERVFNSVRLSEMRVNEILGKHPGLSDDARAMLKEAHHAGRLTTPEGIQDAVNKVNRLTIDTATQGPSHITAQMLDLYEQLYSWNIESRVQLSEAYKAAVHATSIHGRAAPEYMKALTEVTRGLKQADRTARINKGMDELIKMSDDVSGAASELYGKFQRILDSQGQDRIVKADWANMNWHVARGYGAIGKPKGYKFEITDAMKLEVQELIDSLPIDLKFDLKGISIDPAKCNKAGGSVALYDSIKKEIVLSDDWAGGLNAYQKESFYHEMGHAVLDKKWKSGEGIQLLQDFASEVAGNTWVGAKMQKWWADTFTPGYTRKVTLLNETTGKEIEKVLTGKQVRNRMRAHAQAVDEGIVYRDWHEFYGHQFEHYCVAPDDITAEAFKDMFDEVDKDMFAKAGMGSVTSRTPIEVAERSLTFFRKNFPRSTKVTQLSPSAQTGYQDLQRILIDIQKHRRQFGISNFASRRAWFRNKPKGAGDEWWAEFGMDMLAQVDQFDIENVRLWGEALGASRRIDRLARPGVERAPITRKGPLSNTDIANVLGVRTDDISSKLLETMGVHHDKRYFVEYVMRHLVEGDAGFTRESIGAAYDQIVASLKVSDRTLSWTTAAKKETEAVRKELHELYLQGAHSQNDLDAIKQWGKEVGEGMDEFFSRGGAAPGEPVPGGWRSQQGAVPEELIPEGTVPKEEFIPESAAVPEGDPAELAYLHQDALSQLQKPLPRLEAQTPSGAMPADAFGEFNAARQRAMDRAHKQYYKEFPDYSNQNAADAAMKTIYPFWTYESSRWQYLPRLFMQKPGVFTQFMRYQDNSENGYIPLYGDVQFNPFRGTVFGTMSTRLFKRDYPEYYDRLGPVIGAGIETMDFLSRFGFYPGVHVSAPLSLFGGLSPQTGEILPSIVRTPLNLLMAAFPDNEWVNTLTEAIFPERYRDYMTSLQATKYGGDGPLLLAKIKNDVELTEEEQAIWTQARQYVGVYGAIAEQFGLFRMRPEEKVKIREAAYGVIEGMTGFTKDQQIWLERHGYRIWDVVGGLSKENQAILEEMDYFKWVGHGQALLPSRQQLILDRNTLDWDEVNRFVDAQDVTRQQLQYDFMSGLIGPRAYNDEMATMFRQTAEMIARKQEENPYMTPEGKIDYYNKFGIPMPVDHPMKELLRLCHSVKLEKVEDKETGEKVWDWDSFFAHRQIVIDSLPDNLRHEWEAEIQKNMTDIEIIRHDVYNTYFRKYFDVAEITREQFPENEAAMITEYYSLNRRGINLDRQAAIKAFTSALTGNNLISSYQTNLSDNRRALRYKNPHLDAWLYYWGRTDSFLTPAAESMYPTIAQQTGRSIIK